MKHEIKMVCIFFLLVMCMVGCNTKNEQTENSAAQPLIGITLHSEQDPFTVQIRDAIAADAHNAVRLVSKDCQRSHELEEQYLDSFIAAGAAGLAVNAVDRKNVLPLLEKAKAADIPIVFFNREPTLEAMSYYKKAYYVGSKSAESGIMQGQMAVSYFKNNPSADKNHDGVIQYVLLTGEPGHQGTELRSMYSVRTIQDAGLPVEVLAQDTAMWQYQQAKEKMAAFIAQFTTRIELVLANNDEMALGAIAALQEAGYFKDNYIPVLGVDASPAAFDAIEQGLLLGTVLNDAQRQGSAIFELIAALAENRSTAALHYKIQSGKYIWIPYQMVTKANIQHFRSSKVSAQKEP